MSSNVKINNSDDRRIKILVAPLDWGLGHATRCIPVIKELLNQECEVWVAAAGAQRALLQEEFPLLSFVELPGYGIKYGKNRAFTVFRLLFSVPKILIRIKQENAWLRQFQASERFDAVISDNRYGLHTSDTRCIFMTHQLRIRTPLGPWADGWLQRINYRAIGAFSRCWIPDEEDRRISLAGDLSHPRKNPSVPIRYIGWLSRFDILSPARDAANAPVPIDLLVLLSGPEPQRTLLEKLILEQSASLPDIRIALVRGLPGGGSDRSLLPAIPPNMEIFPHLPAHKLGPLIQRARLVLSRAGYSTIMDLVRLNKKAILIPTPGQTEQEYLGSYLAEKGWKCMAQHGFSLAGALELIRDQPAGHPGQPLPDRMASGTTGLLAAAIQELLTLIGGMEKDRPS